MRILIVDDGSSYADMATEIVEALQLPSQTEVTIMTVVPEHTFLGGITLSKLRDASIKKEAQQQKALELLQQSVQALSTSKLKVDNVVRWGDPADEILKVANELAVSLVVMGAKGLTDPLAFRIGSVASAVMKHAKASVLLVRQTTRITNQVSRAKKKAVTINRILIATDGSKYSDMVTRFLLGLPLRRHCEVIVVTALQSYLAALIKMPTLDFQTNQELLVRLQATEESEALKLTAKSEKEFNARGYKTSCVVLRGGAAESILAAAKRYEPDIIALGSRGLSGIESRLLGSVAERVASHADCSVLIGRASK